MLLLSVFKKFPRCCAPVFAEGFDEVRFTGIAAFHRYPDNTLSSEQHLAGAREAERCEIFLIGGAGDRFEILCQLGFDFGSCRHPFLPVSDADKKLIAEEIIPLLTKRP